MDSSTRSYQKIQQLAKGFRCSVDSVILAKSVQCKNDSSLLDVGCGVGSASILAVHRMQNVRVVAVDIDKKAVELAQKNYADNGVLADVRCVNIKDISFLGERFDHVITNPPFFQRNEGRISPAKGLAKHELVPLETWIKFCAKHLKPKGILTIIHLPERLCDILRALPSYIGGITITPVAFKNNEDAKRIIITGQHSSLKKLTLRTTLMLYNNSLQN